MGCSTTLLLEGCFGVSIRELCRTEPKPTTDAQQEDARQSLSLIGRSIGSNRPIPIFALLGLSNLPTTVRTQNQVYLLKSLL